jgi:hypothetical protein
MSFEGKWMELEKYARMRKTNIACSLSCMESKPKKTNDQSVKRGLFQG